MNGRVEFEEPNEAKFDGAWVDDEGAVIIIDSGKMTGSDGDVLDLELGSGGTCSFRLADGQVFGGTLAENGQKLCWSDGVVWDRKTSAAAKPKAAGAAPSASAPKVETAPAKAKAAPTPAPAAETAPAKAEGPAKPKFSYRPISRPAAPAPPAAEGGAGAAGTAARKENEGGATAAASSGEPKRQEQAPPTERVEVTVRHAIQGAEMKVVLPKHAKFKHIKKALAMCLGSDDILTKAQLAKKVGGVYKAYKDHVQIGSVRQVLMVGVDLNGAGSDDGGAVPVEAALSEGEMSEEEVPEPEPPATPARTQPNPSAKRAPLRKGKGATSPSLTKKQAISLQRELYEGFKADTFLLDLKRLDYEHSMKHGSNTTPQHQQERQELFLQVQSKVLPKYGFEGTLAGVYTMMGGMGPYIKDPEFIKLATDINKILGIAMPQDSWDNLAKSCQNLPATPGEAPPREALMGGIAKPSTQQGSTSAPPRAPLPSLNRVVPPPPRCLDPAKRPAAIAAAETEGPGHRTQEHRDEPETARVPELQFDPWPVGKKPYFKLFVVGTWNDFQPVEMEWQGEVFLFPIQIGSNGWESFQILKNGSWDQTVYPSIADATPYEEHTVCGPDSKGHDKNWMIGKYTDDKAKPGAEFAIIAAIDRRGKVAVVSWQIMA